jgi:hypothetical protein
MRRILTLAVLAVAGAVFLAPASVAGQTPDGATVTGVVVDAITGAPLAGSAVRIDGLERSTTTGPNGEFQLRGVPPGRRLIIVRQLGYVQLREALVVQSDGGPLRLELQPDPVMLQAIRVQLDRFERRRAASGRAVRAFDRRAIMAAPVGAMDQWVSSRGGLSIRPCPDPMDFCVLRRGRRVRVTVFIDDQRAIGGFDDLIHYDPADIELVEIWDGRQIRVYTQQYVARRALGPGPTIPVDW